MITPAVVYFYFAIGAAFLVLVACHLFVGGRAFLLEESRIGARVAVWASRGVVSGFIFFCVGYMALSAPKLGVVETVQAEIQDFGWLLIFSGVLLLLSMLIFGVLRLGISRNGDENQIHRARN